MSRLLKVVKETVTADDLAGLEVNGHRFECGKPNLAGLKGWTMRIPETFRFKSEIIFGSTSGDYLYLGQMLTRWPEFWSGDEAISRISFRDEKIGDQIKVLFDELVTSGVCEWEVS